MTPRTDRVYRGPLPPSIRAAAMMHAGGVPAKQGATALGLTVMDCRSRVRDAVERLGPDALGGRIQLGEALAVAYRP